MVEEKQLTLCKKYEAHNRTFWFIYPLLGFNVEVSTLVRELVSKSNLYIGDKECPYEQFNDNMVIYVIKYKEYADEDKKEILEGYFKGNSKFVYEYSINEYKCFIFEFKEDKAEIYKSFRESKYSEMDKVTTLNYGFERKLNYGEVFISFADISKANNYAHNVYHAIKKTDFGKNKFNNWLKSIGIREITANETELESKLIEKEEILRYDNNTK